MANTGRMNLLEEVGRIEVYEAKTDQLAARQADLQTSEKLAQALELLTTQLTQVAFKERSE